MNEGPDDHDGLVIQSSDMALINVASLAATGSLDLSPRFQRRNRWDRAKQSRLIESFLINVPVPPVYLAEEVRGVFAVIDGKQRLQAIADYFAGQYALSGLTFRPDLNGTAYGDLDSTSQSTLDFRPLRAVMVMRQTADWVKHEVFLRLNTGGQPLNPQEIRNVAFAGSFNDRIISLAESPFLRQQLKIQSEPSAAYADMSDVESVVRFFALAERWQDFGGDLRGALDSFMAENHRASSSEITAFAARFQRALDACHHIWGDLAFRRFDGKQWRDQMIGGVYDAQMVSIDSLPDAVVDRARAHPRLAIDGMAELFSDPDFDAAVRLNTNTSTRVRLRIERVRELLSSLP